MFRRLLNPSQVVDLSERDPVAALEWCRLLGDKSCNVLVAGGDGTVAWLLNSIHKLRLKVRSYLILDRVCPQLLYLIFILRDKATN